MKRLDTPRTDEECFAGLHGVGEHVEAAFAEQGGRELIISLSKLKECERQISQLESENVRNEKDKIRLDWLQSGHGVVALHRPSGKSVFTANFEEQDWDEHEDVRKAIDLAMSKKVCPNCGNNHQVWINQITKRLTCHRWGCNNVEIE